MADCFCPGYKHIIITLKILILVPFFLDYLPLSTSTSYLPFSTYAKIFEKVTFLPSEEAHGACFVSIIDFELWRGDRSKRSHCSFQSLLLVRDHLFSTYSKLSKKLSFLTSSEHFAYI